MLKTPIAIVCGFGLAISFPAIAAEKVSQATLDNLLTAYAGERNAHTRYLAFARQADVEGYPGAASLFRAAARAEEIHAENHAKVIRNYGGVPKERREDWMVRSTGENLLTAIRGETFERDEMYASFIRQAETEGANDALRTFRFAIEAEKEHARLYRDTLDRLSEMTEKRTFYVCPTCGFTAGETDWSRCPTCATPREQFEQVS